MHRTVVIPTVTHRSAVMFRVTWWVSGDAQGHRSAVILRVTHRSVVMPKVTHRSGVMPRVTGQQ